MVWERDEVGAYTPSNPRRILMTDSAPNASSKTLAFADLGPANSLRVVCVRVEFVASATAGNRVLILEQLDSEDDVVLAFPMANTAIAAGVSRDIQWMVLGRNATGLLFTTVTPNLAYEDLSVEPFMTPGQKLRVRDLANIDAAADDMVVHVHGLLE